MTPYRASGCEHVRTWCVRHGCYVATPAEPSQCIRCGNAGAIEVRNYWLRYPAEAAPNGLTWPGLMDVRTTSADFSPRAMAVLSWSLVAETLADVVCLSVDDLRGVNGCGPRTLAAIQRTLAKVGLALGMGTLR